MKTYSLNDLKTGRNLYLTEYELRFLLFLAREFIDGGLKPDNYPVHHWYTFGTSKKGKVDCSTFP